MKSKSLRWSGSNAAMREHQEALEAHPPRRKSKKGRKPKKKRVEPQKGWRELYGTYAAYLQSPWWKQKRKQKLESVGSQCQRCRSTVQLQVHHRHYKSIGCEKNRDLEALCRLCHEREHEGLIAANSHLDAINRVPV